MDKSSLQWFHRYFRYVNYIAAAQLYLKDNFFLQRKLLSDDIKDRILGHWGTVPGLNFIYEHCNYLISKTRAEMMFIVGPGHGAPAVLANLFAEGTLGEFYKNCPPDGRGTSELIRSFSWPGGFPSHTYPGVPGSILEGGELGYSLGTAYGAVLDNPDLIAVCVVGDGESETGALCAAWHSNKFLNPAESGAVLPIVHVNGYKISGPTILGTMSDGEISDLFHGYGYNVQFVSGDSDCESRMHVQMARAMQNAYDEIRFLQHKARSSKKPVLKPQWPVIVLRSAKGWTGIRELKGKKVEGSFRSHGIPLSDPKMNPSSLKILENWLASYRITELVDEKGRPLPDLLKFVPSGHLRMGKNKYAFGGNMRKDLKMPDVVKYEVKISPKNSLLKNQRGVVEACNTEVGAAFVRDIFLTSKKDKNFRYFCPDETESNKMHCLFDVTNRAYMWPLQAHDEHMGPTGRVMEVLSEQSLQAWLEGYLLTGRHGLFGTYEAFATIVSSMVDQYAKFLKQSTRVPWRKPISSLNYILTSLGWRQEHNGYSHQNPGFISSVLQKHGAFSSVYFPVDANSLLITLEDCFKRTNSINVIAAGKQPMPQWLTLEEAREQIRVGVSVWKWAHPGSENPDVILAAAGDHMTLEAMAAISILKEMVPELHVRFVNVSELTALGIGDERMKCLICHGRKFEKFFGKERTIIFNFHGYPDVIKQLTWGHKEASRFLIHGYLEEGTTTTPFDMQVRNKTSRYHLCIDAIREGAKFNKVIAKKAAKLIRYFENKLDEHSKYIVKYGKDLPEVEGWRWDARTK